MRIWSTIALSILAATAACSGDDAGEDRSSPARDAGPTVPVDDDSDRLAHCGFTAAPAREARPSVGPGPVRAGYGSAIFRVPIGVPMGGYGGRATTITGSGTPVDERADRFTKALVPSAGLHDAPRAHAVALEAGGERLVLVRADLPVFVENTLFELESALAEDGSMRGRIVVTASHSHAAFAAWPPSYAIVPGMDRPLRQVHDEVIRTLADAAREALDTLEPARIGFATAMDLDVDDRVSRDRREENDGITGPDGNRAGAGKDPVTWALRVDQQDGDPIAALVSVPIHGTVGGEKNPLASTDAPGAIGRALTAKLGYPVLHVQGAGGDVEPAGSAGRIDCPDALRCLDIPRMETIGAHAAEVFAPLVENVETTDQAAFEVVTRTFYVGRSTVVERPDGSRLYYPAYAEAREPDGEIYGDDGGVRPEIDEFNARSGAALCGGQGSTSLFPIPGTQGVFPYASCFDVESIVDAYAGLFGLPGDIGVPLCESVRTTATAVRFNLGGDDDLMLLTVPGEPTAPFTTYLRSRSPAGPDRTLVVGYAQDYVGYVLTVEDWLAGGYEPSLNVWGPLEGEMILAGILDAATLAATPELEDPERSTSRFAAFEWPDVEPVTPVATTDHGTIPASLPALFWPDVVGGPGNAQPDSAVPRVVGAARFVWLGGDPAADFPEVTIERDAPGGSWEPVASSFDGAVVVAYTPDPLNETSPTRHYFAATWQPVPAEPFALDAPDRPYGLPTGTYRFRVGGDAMTTSGVQAYGVTSESFAVTEAPLATASAVVNASTLALSASLGRAPGLRALREGASDLDVALPAPWTVTVTYDDATTSTHAVTPSPTGDGSVDLPAGGAARAVEVEVRDPAGNGGTIAVQ